MVKMLKRGSARELAELLGISERRVNQLVNEEVLHREIEGDFVLTMAIASFYENKYSSKDEDDYWSEKALHEAAKRKLAELELAKRQNLSHDAADVERVMTDMLARSHRTAAPADGHRPGRGRISRRPDPEQRRLRRSLNYGVSFWAYQPRWLLDWRIRAEVLL